MPDFETSKSVRINGKLYYGFVQNNGKLKRIDKEVESKKIDVEKIREGNIMQIQMKTSKKISNSWTKSLRVDNVTKTKNDKYKIVMSDRKNDKQKVFENLKNPHNKDLELEIRVGEEVVKNEINSYYKMLKETNPHKSIFPANIYPIPDNLLIKEYNMGEEFVHMEI